MLHGIAYMLASLTVALIAFMIFVVAPIVLMFSAINYVLCRIFERLTAKRKIIGL